MSEDYDINLNLNLKYIEGKVLKYDEEDFSKKDENYYFEGEYLNGEIWNFQGKFKIKEICVELSVINGKIKILYYYNKNIIIKDEGDIVKGKEMVKIKSDMFGELIFDGIAGIFHKEKDGYYTFIFNIYLIIEGKGKEYYSMGEFSFRGHFLRRKKAEKEKELLFFGTITFESKWFEEKSQNDKEYFYEGELDFDGEHIDRKDWIEKGEKKIRLF